MAASAEVVAARRIARVEPERAIPRMKLNMIAPSQNPHLASFYADGLH
jgi:hypothetical protein